MKTIFKGTVNGKEFDDVKAYNEALLKAINSGEAVKATSKTESEEETEEPDDFSYLDPSEDIYKDGFLYADRLVNGDDEDDAWAYADERERLEARMEEILNAIEDNHEDIDVAALIERYKAAVDDVADDRDRNQATIKSLCKKIETAKEEIKDLEEQLKIAQHADIVIDLYKEHFTDVVTSLDEWLETSMKNTEEPEECTCQSCDCTECKSKEDTKEDLYNSIMKLMREIFK